MKAKLQLLILALGITAFDIPSLKADEAHKHKHNTVVGVFTIQPLAEAMLIDPLGIIESGAGFLFDDGTAVGFDQAVLTPQTQVPPSEVDEFLSQDGILPLDTPYYFVFSTWQLQPNNTVTIQGRLYGGLFGLPDPTDIGVITLSGFVFSDTPVERDLVPFGGNGTADHIEYVDPNPDAQLVEDVADFLVAKGVLNKGRADKIQDYFRFGRLSQKVIEATIGSLVGIHVLARSKQTNRNGRLPSGQRPFLLHYRSQTTGNSRHFLEGFRP